ncbi:MAG: hypothetical protein JEY91_18005, partial [Spirochaetaceae bacterium]|nr:hypothetical protein [Spirochaetaceae bacterium]
MKKIMIYLLMLVFMSSFVVAEESSSETEELKKRLEELETLTEEMEVELDRIRRDEAEPTEEEVLVQKVQWGIKSGLEISGGIMGTGALGTVGFAFPKISFGKEDNKSYLGITIKASIVSDSIPARIFDDNGVLVAEDSRFHILGGPSLTFGSPIFLNFVRIYGGFDLYGGTMLTVDNPYSGNLFLGGI